MKLSVAWIFDHLEADWQSFDVGELVARFNRMTAEIEHTYAVMVDTGSLHCVRIVACDDHGVRAVCEASGKEYILPVRSGVTADQWYLIHQDGNNIRWCTSADIGGIKEFLMPAIDGSAMAPTAAWRSQLETRDVIIDIDNKSITNRPDLWGHRGIAREIGAMFDVPLKPLHSMCAQVQVIESTNSETINGYTIANKAATGCKRFAALSLTACNQRPSSLWMAHRLVRVDARPIDAIVDATNYVMFDLGQPLHAFDTHKFSGRALMPAYGHQGQSLTLLDGQTVTLSHDDLVISDGSHPLALAGIMGGQATAITATTTAILVEAASFDAGMIRKTAARCKKRTDGSARFEKSLDPNQNVTALQRCAMLLYEQCVIQDLGTIVSLGKEMEPGRIELTHAFIERRLGIAIESSFVTNTLNRLGFGCQQQGDTYHVTVPTCRATKDVTIPEDIVEEIARMWGYNRITPCSPMHQIKPADLQPLQRLRTIKSMLANTCGMTELSCYPFFDAAFMRTMGLQSSDAVSVQNPVSENWVELATSLLPMLLKAVHENYTSHHALRFFQVGRVWQQDNGSIRESTHIAGVFFDKKRQINFYDIKQLLSQLFTALNMQVSWHKVQEDLDPWYLTYQTALVRWEQESCGYFGAIDPLIGANIADGDIYLFEFDLSMLTQKAIEHARYTPLSKYPAVHRDISMLVPLRYTADDIREVIEDAHPLITHVSQTDFFEKPEWHDQRSLTFAYVVQSHEKTLTKSEVDDINTLIVQALQTRFSAVIR